ncbi:MAG: GtrA family protein [bacterium]|nr:GtrA family protein [bacterium]
MKLVIKQITKFFIIGVSAVLVDLIVYYALSDLIKLNIDFSKAAGFLIGSVYTYYLNKRWTWRHTEKTNKGMVGRFAVIYAISFVFNILINKYSLEFIPNFEISGTITFSNKDILSLFSLKGDKFLAFFFATVFSAVFNFLGQKYWVFHGLPSDPKDDTNIEVS